MKMQEAAALRKEEVRRTTEKKILEKMLEDEKEKALLKKQNIQANAEAKGEALTREAKALEDYNRKMLLERINGDKEKWIAAINTTFSHIEGVYFPASDNPYEFNLEFLLVLLLLLITHSKCVCLF